MNIILSYTRDDVYMSLLVGNDILLYFSGYNDVEYITVILIKYNRPQYAVLGVLWLIVSAVLPY